MSATAVNVPGPDVQLPVVSVRSFQCFPVVVPAVAAAAPTPALGDCRRPHRQNLLTVSVYSAGAGMAGGMGNGGTIGRSHAAMTIDESLPRASNNASGRRETFGSKRGDTTTRSESDYQLPMSCLGRKLNQRLKRPERGEHWLYWVHVYAVWMATSWKPAEYNKETRTENSACNEGTKLGTMLGVASTTCTGALRHASLRLSSNRANQT